MQQIVPPLRKVEPLDGLKLHLHFENGVQGVTNFASAKKMFDNYGIDFKKVSFTNSALVWSDDVEFDLLNCYLEITKKTFEEYANSQ